MTFQTGSNPLRPGDTPLKTPRVRSVNTLTKDSLRWEGETIDGEPNGYGKLFYPNGDVYDTTPKGQWPVAGQFGWGAPTSPLGDYRFANGDILRASHPESEHNFHFLYYGFFFIKYKCFSSCL